MKKLFLVTFLIFSSSLVKAQPESLFVKSGAKGLYLDHTVAAKEGFFPIGRLYNVHPRHLANYNGLDFNTGLSIGQQLQIPLSDTNFSQGVNQGVPVYYHTDAKENLGVICEKNRNVQPEIVGRWNKLADESVPAGTNLVIGFLNTKEMQDKVVTLSPEKQSVPATTIVAKNPEPVEVKKQTEPEKPITNPAPPEIKKEEPPVVMAEPVKPVAETPVNETIVKTEGGYFHENFSRQIKSNPAGIEQMMNSSVFKSANGWQDAKYYLMINGVSPGTIVKITNPENNKSVYAKVLYAMENVRQSSGIDMRISDAAAAALAISDADKFILKVNY
jgi:hypothetical protein